MSEWIWEGVWWLFLALCKVFLLTRVVDKLIVLVHDANFETDVQDEHYGQIKEKMKNDKVLCAIRRLYKDDPAILWALVCFITWVIIVIK